MAIDTTKKTTIYIKNSANEIVQVMPKTSAECVLYGETNMDAELTRLNGEDVAEAYVELETKSETETEEHRKNCDGTIGPVNNLNEVPTFFINLYYQENGNVQLVNHEFTFDKLTCLDNNTQARSNLALGILNSNVEYGFSFSVPSSISIQGISLRMADVTVTDKNDSTKSGSFVVFPSTIISASSYENYEPASQLESIAVVASIPEEGVSSEWTFNGFFELDADGMTEIPEDDQGMAISISNQGVSEGNIQCNAIFKWTYQEDVLEETVTRWTEMKTTVVKNNEERIVVSKPMSGLMQSISGNVEESIAVDTASLTSYCGIVIGDSEGAPGMLSYEIN